MKDLVLDDYLLTIDYSYFYNALALIS